ncbi:MAG: 16S rRNA (guanine(966)-N(2))-methyltransferase RsmD [Candidatus Saganbacteria bacterium]|nr:16S rRNA (guanine(966)-N(2))-methyltransferase RsmD [Candidatus Saganbacteria bacterium]
MRVISGSAKGKKLKFPKKASKVRPLSDFAKEALFNILAGRVEGAYFLDLFAGTGQVGIEALSRGAKLAIFVETDRNAVSVIRENLELTGFSGCAEIFSIDAVKGVSVLDKNKAKFDIIFIGAPYGFDILEKTLEKIAKSDILKENTVVIAEHSKRHVLPDSYEGLIRNRQEKYGDTVFSFYGGGK